MKKIINKISVLAVLAMTFASCSDFLDREPTDYSTAGFYKSEEAIRDGASGVYHSLYLDAMDGFYAIPFVVYFDHFTPLALPRAENTTIGAGTLNPDLLQVSQLWSGLYITIARANGVLDGSKDYIDGLSDRAKQYIAEVKVIRAYAYYILIATFGDVPFYTSPVTVAQYMDTRTERTVILDFILEDLESAAGFLSWTATDRGRVDKAVALGLKARAALLGGSLNYGGKATSYFTTAAEAAQRVIGQRDLAAKFDDLFNVTGQAKADVRSEMLWELMYSRQAPEKGHATAFGQVDRDLGQTGRHPAMVLADMYECLDGKRIDESTLYDPQYPSKNRDLRFRTTLWMHGDSVTVFSGSVRTKRLEAYSPTTQFWDYSAGEWVSGNNSDINSAAAWASFCNSGVGLIWGKYSNETAENINGTGSCNMPIMRYSEVLLSYAEAKIELNQMDQSVYDAIDAVRIRAGLPVVSADRMGDQWKMRQLVRSERKVEFIMEGLFFVDMRRWGIGDLLNDEPSYGHPFPWLAQARIWLEANQPGVYQEGMTVQQLTARLAEFGLTQSDIPITDGYTLVTPDMIPNFNKTDRHNLNDIASYHEYRDRLWVRDRNRNWKDTYNLWPVPQIERLRNPNLTQNTGY